MNTNEIKSAVREILSRQNLPPRLHSRANRMRAGKLGLASMLRILEQEGWKIEITILPPG